jgi:plasmid maintenance system killer protein
MEWEILHPELESVYINGKSNKLPSIDERVAKKITIRIHQIQTVSGFGELNKIKGIQLLKSKKKNCYSLSLINDFWLLIQIVKTERDEDEKVHIIDIHQ